MLPSGAGSGWIVAIPAGGAGTGAPGDAVGPEDGVDGAGRAGADPLGCDCAGLADGGVRRGAGAGVGVVSPKPGGRSDSGRSCPIAGASAARLQAAASAASVTLGQVRKRHGLLDLRLRALGCATGEQEQPTDDDDQDNDDRDYQAGHTQNLVKTDRTLVTDANRHADAVSPRAVPLYLSLIHI